MDGGRKRACGKTGGLAGMTLARDGTEQGSGITASVWAREHDGSAGGAAASCERGGGRADGAVAAAGVQPRWWTGLAAICVCGRGLQGVVS